MKRDMDLVRELLFDIEAGRLFRDGAFRLEGEGRTRSEIAEHLVLMKQGGLLWRDRVHRLPCAGAGDELLSLATELTWAGHEFLDQIREQGVWIRAKDIALKTSGGLSIEVLKAIILDLLKGAA